MANFTIEINYHADGVVFVIKYTYLSGLVSFIFSILRVFSGVGMLQGWFKVVFIYFFFL